MVIMRQLRDRRARFLKEPISLPRESGPRMNADVQIA